MSRRAQPYLNYRTDEKQIEYKSLRMRRELATTPAWALSRGIEMAKTENRKLQNQTRTRLKQPAGTERSAAQGDGPVALKLWEALSNNC